MARLVPAAAGFARTALLSLVVLAAVLLQAVSPAALPAQAGAPRALRWQATVTYTETAKSPAGHRVKNLEARFELLTPQISPMDVTEGYVWRNVALAYADSGRWHYDVREVEGGTLPPIDEQWAIVDSLAVPAGPLERLTPSALHTMREGARVQDVKLPALPVRHVGSTVLVRPLAIGMLLDVAYGHGMNTVDPKTGTRDRRDLQVQIVAKQPPPASGGVETADSTSSGDYAGLPPEIVASMKLLDSVSGNPGGDLDDDQIAIVTLKMDGFVEFDGKPVAGSREWTTSAAEPGEYTSSIMDDRTSVSHRLVWRFVPIRS